MAAFDPNRDDEKDIREVQNILFRNLVTGVPYIEDMIVEAFEAQEFAGDNAYTIFLEKMCTCYGAEKEELYQKIFHAVAEYNTHPEY